MKVLILLFIVYLNNVNGQADSSNGKCDAETEKIELAESYCDIVDFQLFDIEDKLNQVAENQLTQKDFAEYLRGYCQKAINMTQCYANIKFKVASECRQVQTIAEEINFIEILKVETHFLCDKNGQRYLDMVPNGGIKCYHINQEHIDCFDKELEKESSPPGGNSVRDKNICKNFDIHGKCLAVFDKCANPAVKRVTTELNNRFRSNFRCKN